MLGGGYDLHHYNMVGGWLKRRGDPQADSKTSHVAVIHFFTQSGKRDHVIEQLESVGKSALESEPTVSSFGILKELNDENLVTVWLRYAYNASNPAFTSLTNLEGHQLPRILQHTMSQHLSMG